MAKKNLSKKDLSNLPRKVTDMSLRRAREEYNKDPETGQKVLDHVMAEAWKLVEEIKKGKR